LDLTIDGNVTEIFRENPKTIFITTKYMKRHPIQNPIIQQLNYENHILRTQNHEFHNKFAELQHEFEILKQTLETQTTVLKLLQNKNTELNRELIKKNKQISMLLNSPPNGSSLISEILLDGETENEYVQRT